MQEYSYIKPSSNTIFKPESGKLYLFMPSKIAVLKAWPHVLAWRKRRTHPTWEHFRPKIGIPGQGVEARIRCLEENEDEYGQKLLFVPPIWLSPAGLSWPG